mmetsp:Transcript_19822/g.36436  ORF Transcript_19822/g.36436 Transcript_19822/m.36436 type:complete len:86 (-) Transcript_19822:253-510(-)
MVPSTLGGGMEDFTILVSLLSTISKSRHLYQKMRNTFTKLIMSRQRRDYGHATCAFAQSSFGVLRIRESLSSTVPEREHSHSSSS